MKGPVFLALSSFLLVIGVNGSFDCVDMGTSEGFRTIPHGGSACAPLYLNETKADKGKRYVICDAGRVITQKCYFGLRFDTKLSVCNYREQATCELPGASTKDSVKTTKASTTTTTITTTTRKAIPSPIGQKAIPSRATTTTSTTTTTRPTTTTTRPTTTTTRPTTTTTRRTTTTTTTTTRPPTVKANPPQYSVSRCVDVETYTGTITMQEGDVACDKLWSNETFYDRGKRYRICAAGVGSLQNCPGFLRLNMKTKLCDYPAMTDCGGPTPPATTTTKAPTTTTISTAKPPPANPGAPAPTTTTKRTTTTTRRPPAPAPRSGSCTATNCQLPACFCYGATPSMPLADRPMFIMPTFDDAVTARQYNSYFKPLFVDNGPNITNPNGCRMRSAYYVSHLDTDYNLVKNLYLAKNEIASHTINHRLPLGNTNADYPNMVEEIDGLRNITQQNTGIPNLRDQIVGFRAPFLRVAGDIMFDVLRDYNFLYDTSITNTNAYRGQKPFWPFTLDYLITSCVNPPCPTKSYPGLWEMPMNGWVGDDGFSCSMVDACHVAPSIFNSTEEQWMNFYMKNFNDYFYKEKIPMHFFTHGAIFIRSINSYSAFGAWLKTLQKTHNDVWVVTPKEVIDWMKNPLTNSQMIAQKWGC